MVSIRAPSLLAVATILTVATLGTTQAARVDAGVHRTLRKQGKVNLMVNMKDGVVKTLESIHEGAFTTRGAMIENMVEQLESQSTASQRELVGLLAQESASVEPLYKSIQSYWISNQVFIEEASAELIEKLSRLSSVSEMREEEVISLAQVVDNGAAVDVNSNATEQWGVRMIKANDVWRGGFLRSNTAEGIIVGMIDSGAHGSHEALRDNFRGAYGWYDPERNAAQPYDESGHGTHVVGTMAGANGIGVAPGATWMACKGCRRFGCPESDLLACAQFMTCPTDTDGKNRDCSKAPQLVVNSWGGGQADDFYRAAVKAWHKAGIIPIFANGNAGPQCGTAKSPGDYEDVIAVGATDVNDGLATLSSKGPSVRGLVKPDITAPGKDVYSAWKTSDDAYRTDSGTSMAAPHVAGVVALMLKVNPFLKFEEVRDILQRTAERTTLKPSGLVCPLDPTDKEFPNNSYGHGRVNARAATAASLVECYNLKQGDCHNYAMCQWREDLNACWFNKLSCPLELCRFEEKQ